MLFQLKFEEERPYIEIAAAFGISEALGANVWSYCARNCTHCYRNGVCTKPGSQPARHGVLMLSGPDIAQSPQRDDMTFSPAVAGMHSGDFHGRQHLVNSQITDAVTQTNVKVVAEAPAQAMAALYQVASHSAGCRCRMPFTTSRR